MIYGYVFNIKIICQKAKNLSFFEDFGVTPKKNYLKAPRHSIIFLITKPLHKIVYPGGEHSNSVYYSEILEYDISSDSWKVVGEMRERRAFYGLSPLAEVSEVCP